MRSLTRRTRLLTALAAVTVTAAAVLVVGPGYHASQVRMRSGTVWLASGQTGEATLVDGAAAEVSAHVPVAGPGAALTVAQRGGSAVVLDRRTGRLSTVDSATERVTPAVPALPASDGLVVLPAPDALHVVDVHSGMTAVFDPATLAARGEPRRLAGAIRPGNVALDGRGRLWAIDDTTGDLVWLSGGQRRTRSAAAKRGHLTIVDGSPAVVDPDRGTAELLDPETGAVARSVRLDVRADDTTVIGAAAGRARVLIATGSRGELVSCEFDTGCTGPVQVSSAGAELAAPVEAGNHAVVPDHSTGQVTIVDLATSRVVAQRRLFEQPTPFELIARDGIVFFNDPNSNVAGVLDLAGNVRTVTKYTQGPVAGDVPPTADPRRQADPLTKIDHREQTPGLGLPGRTNRPFPPEPPTTRPTASIVVTPGVHGVVGDEFELTMVLQPATPASTSWSFGDTTGAEAVSTVRHRWQRPGTFTVSATATLGGGRTVRSEVAVTVAEPGAPPSITRIDVLRPRPVVGESVHFSAESTRDLDRWAWTVTKEGEPAPEVTAQTPEFDHAFSTPGIYSVTLTVAKGALTAQFSRQFTVARGAVKIWGGSPADSGLTVPPAASSGVIAIAAGPGHALALKSNGSVIAWGPEWNDAVRVPAEALSGVVAIAAGAQHSLALKSDGSVIAWGTDFETILDVPAAAKHDVIAIAAGLTHSLALKKDGSVIAWGVLWGGPDKWVPAPALTDAVAIAAGVTHSMAVRADGTVVVWGDFTDFNCDRETPVRNVRAVAAGWGSCLALLADGSTTAWGLNFRDQLSIPAAARSDVAAMDTFKWHTLALKTDGSVVGWGDNEWGQASVPPQYSKGALAVAAGEDFSMVLLE